MEFKKQKNLQKLADEATLEALDALPRLVLDWKEAETDFTHTIEWMDEMKKEKCKVKIPYVTVDSPWPSVSTALMVPVRKEHPAQVKAKDEKLEKVKEKKKEKEDAKKTAQGETPSSSTGAAPVNWQKVCPHNLR